MREFLQMDLSNAHIRTEVEAGRGGALLREAINSEPQGTVRVPGGAESVRLLNADRLETFYNHIQASCSQARFPCGRRMKLAVWQAETMTPDIPMKHTAVIKTAAAFQGWSRCLSGNYLVLEINGGRIGGRVESALKSTTHILRLMDNLAGKVQVTAGFFVRFNNNSYLRTGVEADGWILQFAAKGWAYPKYTAFSLADPCIEVWFGQ